MSSYSTAKYENLKNEIIYHLTTLVYSITTTNNFILNVCYELLTRGKCGSRIKDEFPYFSPNFSTQMNVS